MKKKVFFVLILLTTVLVIYILNNFKILDFASSSVDDQLNQRIADCRGQSNKTNCWQEILNNYLFQKGLDKTYGLLAKLYTSESGFPAVCHYITHNLGIAAYKLYLKDKESVLSAKSAYCANGFYHGFMEAFLTARQEPSQARQFCEYADKKLAKLAPDALFQCYHGIGHGGMDLAIRSKENWGDEEKLTASAIKLCEQASGSTKQLYHCVSGVFNAIANYYISGEYGIKINNNDPLRFCHRQQEKYKEACFGNMNSFLIWFAKGDILKAGRYLEEITDEKIATVSVRYLGAIATLHNLNSSDYSKMIGDCRKLEKKFRSSCIEGLVHGFLEHGTPGLEYEDAFSFCKTDILTSEEKDVCFKYSLSGLSGWYSKKKAEQICLEADEIYRKKYCRKF